MLYDEEIIPEEETPEEIYTPIPEATPESETSCTLVYLDNGAVICEEDIITVIPTPEPSIDTEPQKVEIVKTAPQASADAQLANTINTIRVNQEKLLLASDDTVALQLYEDNQRLLEEIKEYISIFVVLYMIVWIISVFNSWRRSND